jgi:uncharacterized integral membrane protein
LYRIGFIIIAALAISLGLLIGTLNHALVPVDLLWVQFQWPLGLLLIAALAAGLLIGVCLIWLFTVLPLRLQLGKARKISANNTGFPDNPND